LFLTLPTRGLTGQHLISSDGQDECHSFNHLVGAGQDRWRDGKAKHLCGLQVDYQLECGRLLHRQVGWLDAVENPTCVNADLAKDTGEVRSIADRTTGRDKLTRPIDRRDRIA